MSLSHGTAARQPVHSAVDPASMPDYACMLRTGWHSQ